MSEHKISIVFLLVFAILFVGCSTYPDSQEPATPFETSTQESTYKHTLTSTASTIPPSATVSPTQRTSYTPTPSPTYDRFSGRRLISPDSQWTAIQYYREEVEPPLVSLIEISNQDGSVIWEIPYSWDFELDPDIPDPSPSYFMHHWSPDSRYFYYYFLAVGCGIEPYFNAHTLYRINVKTGLTSTILTGEGPIAFAFSPNDDRIAFIRYDHEPLKIVVMDLNTWEQKGVTVRWENPNDYGVGKITWSPDGSFIIYFTLSEITNESTDFIDLGSLESSIIRLDLDNYIQTTLSEELVIVYSTEWTGNGQLRIFADNGDFLLDPLTGVLEEIED